MGAFHCKTLQQYYVFNRNYLRCHFHWLQAATSVPLHRHPCLRSARGKFSLPRVVGICLYAFKGKLSLLTIKV